jgi:hypothetical protein
MNVAPDCGASYRPRPMRTELAHWFDRSRSAVRQVSLASAVCSVLLSACGLHTDWSGHGIRRQAGGTSGSLGAHRPAGQSTTEMGQTSQVVSAWFSAEQAFNTAALTSDANQPDLAVTTMSPQLNWTRTLLQEMRSAGEVARGVVEYGSPRVTDLDAHEATVQSCVHDSEIVVLAASGQPVSGVLGQVDFELITSTMESTISGWKLLSQRVGVDQCD